MTCPTSVRSTKSTFVLGLMLGALLAGGAFLIRQRYTMPTAAVSPADLSKGSHPEPQWWLLPKDFSLDKIYTEPGALSVLDAPDEITIHRAVASAGAIAVLGHTFAAAGVSPQPPDAKILLAAFNSLNAYTPPSACLFQPGVLVRLRRGEHRLDILVCFDCEDLAWTLDGHETLAPQAGLSDLGIGVLRSVLTRVFPNDPFFRSP